MKPEEYVQYLKKRETIFKSHKVAQNKYDKFVEKKNQKKDDYDSHDEIF